MPATTRDGAIRLTLNLQFDGVKEGEQPPETTAFVFDANGQFVSSAPIENATANLDLPGQLANRTVRLFVGRRRQQSRHCLGALSPRRGSI